MLRGEKKKREKKKELVNKIDFQITRTYPISYAQYNVTFTIQCYNNNTFFFFFKHITLEFIFFSINFINETDVNRRSITPKLLDIYM